MQQKDSSAVYWAEKAKDMLQCPFIELAEHWR
jgi:hypothetical protein